ncbi:1620_t:CDS:2 [Funneliformis geosporum]|nr:1620_t:CDS:2 [Funneliformis geosporum]
MSLGEKVIEYSTFKKKDDLLKDHFKPTIKLFQSKFLTSFEAVQPINSDLVNYLTSEEVLISNKNLSGYFKVSSFLVYYSYINKQYQNERVSRESVYDAKLYQIMSNWLSRFILIEQWHLKYCTNECINHKYVDIIIVRSDHPTIALELLATATKTELKKYYEQVFTYDKKLPANEI